MSEFFNELKRRNVVRVALAYAVVGLVLAVDFLLLDKFYLASEPVAEVKPVVEVAQPSIAVLPFSDLSSQGDQEYFADGVSEEILNVLVRVNDLTVASRTSSFHFKDVVRKLNFLPYWQAVLK